MRECIDGASFAQAIIHAAASINLQKQQINELNVFPVPDGDTGTNMSLTISTAAAELRKKHPKTVSDAAAANASALLRGARGNSGVILSLLFRGFAKAVKDKDVIDGRELAIALDFGVAAAYKAVMKPAEGTILTVSRLAAALAADAARATPNDPEAVLEAAIAEGQLALENTINQNPVLKKAGVVDAGGKGFLVILQGMLDSMRGLPLPEESGDHAKPEQKTDYAAIAREPGRPHWRRPARDLLHERRNRIGQLGYQGLRPGQRRQGAPHHHERHRAPRGAAHLPGPGARGLRGDLPARGRARPRER